MAERAREAVHQEPVWRARSNFIIAADILSGGDTKTEQLWARQIDQYRFEICCIPFFVYDLALGDVVETDANYIVQRVAEPSGRYVFRVWLDESFRPRGEIAEELTALGSLIEWSSGNLLAVDAMDEDHAKLVADFLAEKERQKRVIYETGRR